MFENAITLGEPLAIRAACHALINFNIASPPGAQLVLEHLNGDQLLARENRPLPDGARGLEVKIPPEASHIACSIQHGGEGMNGVVFTVDCGAAIEPAQQHFIVIGAMKAGTTTLFELLAQHPAICRTFATLPGVSLPKEINYFIQLYRKGHTPLHYDWRFPFEPAKHAWTLEVSPNYTKYPRSKGVPWRIASFGGRTRLAYILRNPIDRIESHLAHVLRHGYQKHLPHCIRTSRYAFQLDRFTQHIDSDDILLLDFEQLKSDPAGLMAKVCDFLEVERLVTHSVIHNTRSVEFRLSSTQRAELKEAVRDDVQRLISVYGFTPAAKWLE